jgi:hypothetical protein
MSLEFSGHLFSGSQRNGTSLLVGIGAGDRYSLVSSLTLAGAGLFSNVNSVEIFTTDEADGNIILFQSLPGLPPVPGLAVLPEYSGAFLQMHAKKAAGGGTNWWNFGWQTSAALLVAGNRKGHKEARLSFSDFFLQTWNTFLDNTALAGTAASREGDPTLTWEMFPVGIDHLDPNGIYLKIVQPLHITISGWSDYAAQLTYHISLFVNGQHHLRVSGQRWAAWVEGGIKSQHIYDTLQPLVANGLTQLATQMNALITKNFDVLLGTVTDVYYLPGHQPTDPATGTMQGVTFSDVTIVVEH